MKKALIMLLTFTLLFTFASCNNHNHDPEVSQTNGGGNESATQIETAIDLAASYYSEGHDGLHISVTTPRFGVARGQSFSIMATVTNNTDRPLEYTYGCCSDSGHKGIVAQIGDGNHEFLNVSEITRYYDDGFTTETLEVGESISETITFMPAWSECDKELLANVFTSSLTPVWNMPCIPYEVEELTNGVDEAIVADYLYYNFENGIYNGKASFEAYSDGGRRTVSVNFSINIADYIYSDKVEPETDTVVCSEPTAPANFGFLKPVQYSQIKDGLVLDVFAPAKVPYGQDFTVSAIITNTTDKPITYTLVSCTPDMHLEIDVDIKDKNGRAFIDKDTAGKCMAEAMLQKTLAPGESFQQVIRFSPSWSNDLSMGLEYSKITYFEEGNYYGTAEFRWDKEGGGDYNSLSLEFPVEIIDLPQ